MPVDKNEAAARYSYEHIAEQLRSAILSQDFMPGSRLPNENELSEMFKVSRTTVREALRGLAAENLITTRKGTAGGSFVTEPSVAQLAERLQVGLSMLASTTRISLDHFMELRRLLEVPSADLAAERRTGDDLALLEETIPPPRGALSDQEQYCSNRDFHFVIIDICHNPLLRLAVEPMFVVLQTCLDRTRLPANFHTTVTRQHRAIAGAIQARDGDLACKLMQDHLDWLHPRYRRVWQTPGSQQ
jgi:DNA-binding FadR family transcriptional regulator